MAQAIIAEEQLYILIHYNLNSGFVGIFAINQVFSGVLWQCKKCFILGTVMGDLFILGGMVVMDFEFMLKEVMVMGEAVVALAVIVDGILFSLQLNPMGHGIISKFT